MVVAAATEARGVATVAVAMRAVAMVAAVAEGTIYYARCGSARHHPASHQQHHSGTRRHWAEPAATKAGLEPFSMHTADMFCCVMLPTGAE